MVFGPINIKPQERTIVRERPVANTAKYIDVNGAGAGFGALQKAFSKFAGKMDKEQEKAQIEMDEKALEAYMVESFKNPTAAREASRSGDYSSFVSVRDRMTRPLIQEGLHSINASAMTPGLVQQLSTELDSLQPGQDAVAFRQSFIEREIEGLPPGVARRLIESVTKGSESKVASVKQAQIKVFNNKQVDNLRNGLNGLLESNGSAASMAGIEQLAASAMSALQGPDLAKAEMVRETVAEAIVRAQSEGGPASVRAAQLAAQTSILFDGGSVNSSFDEDTRWAWRMKAARADQDNITKFQKDMIGAYQRKMLTDPGNSQAHFQSFTRGWLASGGNINHPNYVSALRMYVGEKTTVTAQQEFEAGKREFVSEKVAKKGIQDILDQMGRTDYQMSLQDLTMVVKYSRNLDGGLSSDNQHTLGNALMNPRTSRGIITAIRAMQTSPEGYESQFRPAELLGEGSRSLAVYAIMAGQDLSGENLQNRLDEALGFTKAMANDKNAFETWARSQDNYNSRQDPDPLAWFVEDKADIISRDTGIPMDILKDKSKWSPSLRQYLQGNLNMAVNLDPDKVMDGDTLAGTQGMFAGRREFIEVNGKVYPVKTKGIAKDANGDLVATKDPGLPKDVANMVGGDTDVRPTEDQPGTSVATNPVNQFAIEVPAGQTSVVPESWSEVLGFAFSRVETDDPGKLLPGQFAVIGGQTYFHPLPGKEGRRVDLDPSKSDYLEFKGGQWRRVIDHARAPGHTANVGLVASVLNSVKGNPDAVLPRSALEAAYSGLKSKRSAITLSDSELFGGAAQFAEGVDGPAFAARFENAELTEADLARLPVDYFYEYNRRVLGDAEGPMPVEELTNDMLKVIMGVTEVPEVTPPGNAPTTVDTSEGPSNQEAEIEQQVIHQTVRDAVAQGDAHPSALDNPDQGYNAIAAANAENNFVPAAPEVAMSTAKYIIDSYPVTNWKEASVMGLGDHALSRANNPIGIQHPGGDDLSFSDHNEGILHAGGVFLDKFQRGSTTIRQLLGRGFRGTGRSVVDSAETMLGKAEYADPEALTKYFNTAPKGSGRDVNPQKTPWCAAFVNAALSSQGLRGSGSLVATSFLNWGDPIGPREIAKGDVLIEARGLPAGQTGGHVGMATGVTKVVDGNYLVEMLGGNQGDKVTKKWVNVDDLDIRRGNPQDALPEAPFEGVPTTNMSELKTVARHVGVDLDQTIELGKPEVLTRFLQGMAEVNLGAGAKTWAPYIKAAINGKPMDLPSGGTGDMVTGAGFRLDWPTSEAMLEQAGVKDIGKVTEQQSEALVYMRVDSLMKQLPQWFDGAELSGAQRGALAQFLYTSPWSAETGRPLILTDKLIAAIQSGDTSMAAKLIRRETRVFRQGLNEHQKDLQRHALKLDRSAIATRFENN